VPEVFNYGRPIGVFVGLATLDVVHRVDAPPGVNQKVTATAQFVAAGGPAANAAVTFASLGGQAILVTALGSDAVAELIRYDLAKYGVFVVDVDPTRTTAAPISAVSVVTGTGDRSVVSIDAVGHEVLPPVDIQQIVAGADVVLVDGHHPLLAVSAAVAAHEAAITVVVDAGRWKPVMESLIPFTTSMVCSGDFLMPGTSSSEESATELVGRGIATVVTTHGGNDVDWWHGGDAYWNSLPGARLETTLTNASRVAALKCSIFGPREWLPHLTKINF
jgi:sugar/nucleoside kinase (ribokinase family)